MVVVLIDLMSLSKPLLDASCSLDETSSLPLSLLASASPTPLSVQLPTSIELFSLNSFDDAIDVTIDDGDGEESFSEEIVESGEEVIDNEFIFGLLNSFVRNSFGVKRPLSLFVVDVDESGLGQMGNGDNGT